MTVTRLASWVALAGSPVGRVAGPVVIALGSTLPTWEARIGAVLFGGALVAVSEIAVQRRVRQLEALGRPAVRDDVAQLLSHTVDLLERLKPVENGRFRASLFTVDEARNRLFLETCTRGYTAGQRRVTWSEGEGPAGLAWKLGRPVMAPRPTRLPRRQLRFTTLLPGSGRGQGNSGRRNARRKDLAESPLSPDQVDFLRDIEMMVCFPLTDMREPDRIVGILTLDDRVPPGRHLEDVLTTLDLLSEEIRRRLSHLRSPGGSRT